jgi:predicted metal-dependent hydrolase
MPDHFREGIDLFNAGQFFECHEAWEEVWKRSDGVEKLFYQGMIQAAVAILHAQRGNFEGARSLWSKASEKLDPLPREHHGIALGEFRDALGKFFAVVLSETREPAPPPPAIRDYTRPNR